MKSYDLYYCDFLNRCGFFYNLIISVEVASRTKALKRALAEKDRISKQQEQTNEYISRLERTGIVGQMSSMIAHELKQPLATVSNYSRGLLRRIERGSADKDTIVKVLKEIEYHTERANDIVDHVRSYAKPHEVKREEHDLRDIVAKTVATFEKSGRTTVPVIVEGERHALVEADDWEIELALLNLLKIPRMLSRRFILRCVMKTKTSFASVLRIMRIRGGFASSITPSWWMKALQSNSSKNLRRQNLMA